MTTSYQYFATCPKGVDDLLIEEFESLGLSDLKASTGGVSFSGEIEDAYKACLWSRCASRILLQLKEFEASDYDVLYENIRAISWEEHLSSTNTFAIDCFTSSDTINNSHFATLKIKDAIVDYFTDRVGDRPDVSKDQPDIRINIYISNKHCLAYLDLSGEPLHKRGYRVKTGEASLKENLAAAILMRARWSKYARKGKPLLDPMCGTGTLLIEAAYIASNRAPGLLRDYYGFIAWKQHRSDVWEKIIAEAESACETEFEKLPQIRGVDISSEAIEACQANIKSAGFENIIEIKLADCIEEFSKDDSSGEQEGIIVTNPPYGKRLGEVRALKTFYYRLGSMFKEHFGGWDVCLFTPEHELARSVGLRAHHKNTLYNGPLKCTLYRFRIDHRTSDETKDDSNMHENAMMFSNRLTKNYKHLKKWARRNDIQCYRVYDADIPEYAVAIDIYDRWLLVQEYEAPATINEVKAFHRLSDIMQVISNVLGVAIDKIVLKTRKKQKGAEQYTRLSSETDKHDHSIIVIESGLKFKVNLQDYLDTGLFLDHRKTRRLIRNLAEGKSFLNLFAYTGVATVYAAAGGARKTTTVDLSNTYIEWAQDNLKLNKLTGKNHRFERADCMQWLWDEKRQGGVYDLIFLDPPTFSNSKKMNETLDIKRDHSELIDLTMRLLDKQGILIFSCNAKKFKLDKEIKSKYEVKLLSAFTTTEDFKRKPVHKCWAIAKSSEALDFSLQD